MINPANNWIPASYAAGRPMDRGFAAPPPRPRSSYVPPTPIFDPIADVSYRPDGTIRSIDGKPVTYGPDQRIRRVGTESVAYGADDRLKLIGNKRVTYWSDGTIRSVR